MTSLKKIEKELPLDLPVSSVAVSRPGWKRHDHHLARSGRKCLPRLGARRDKGTCRRNCANWPTRNGEHRIRIDGDRATPLAPLVQVLDMCNFEGLKNVGIRTKKIQFSGRDDVP